MSRKRKYNLATLLIIGVIFFGWTTFLEFSGAPETANASGEENVSETVDSAATANTPAAPGDTQVQVKTADNTEKAAPTETPVPTEKPAETTSEPASEPVPTASPTPEATPEPTDVPEPTPEEKPYEIKSFAVAKVTDFVNIRDIASSSGNLIGKLYKNGFGYMLEKGETFSRIESGPVTGYISNSYLYTGSAALQLLKENEAFKIKITGTEVNVRAAAGSEAEIIRTATNGTSFVFYPEESTNLWYSVKLENGGKGYISSSVCEEYMDFGVAEVAAE